MKVYIVFEEYQADEPSFIGVFMDEALAEREAEARREVHRAAGANVWGDHSNDDSECEWSVDVKVQPMEVVQ